VSIKQQSFKHDPHMVRQCNAMITTVCNSLWRFKAYTTDGKLLV